MICFAPVALAGSILRNTDWIHGFVLYTGEQSKIMMNSRSSRNKRSNMEHTINRLLILIGVFFILFCIISSLLYDRWTSDNQKVWYVFPTPTHTPFVRINLFASIGICPMSSA